ncbi:putative Flp pilus-assembly TadE/G-like protein [Murinocardiopsis flavida]|uniref:Putative Flp pilus-assembly TadE/G-like protein n=1 Tax=Murinocardiopsis flavida TaxID=645275 RepID=A0A2P8CY92_9ACTN|nr:pilus assembly protein TadG-related protein [Murinocardiopsis flavida]PSK89942.1 putative Flp pilus-assembly TadE/G-like protein [Murinocardiopsis flavida]
MTRRDDRGQVTAFVVIIALALVLLLALVLEGGAALGARSRALSLAQEAARAGAQQIDLDAYRAGDDITLDTDAAAQAAKDFLHRSGAEGTAYVEGDTVTATAHLNYTFSLLPLGTRTLSGTASASPHTDP